jgi:hypothetical protein
MIFVADISGIFANGDVLRYWLLINISILHMSLRKNVSLVKCKVNNKRLVDLFWNR